MGSVIYQGASFIPEVGESVLDLLERHGHAVPSACRSGVCQSCLMRARSGEPPAASQQGVKPSLREQGYFLACRCQPDADLEVELPSEGAVRSDVVITGLTPLSARIIELRTTTPAGFEYRAGQFANLINEHGIARSYSLASVPSLDHELIFQIALVQDGAMSQWLASEAEVGTVMQVQGPNGSCTYAGQEYAQPLLLAGTGTGLAPLYGIARDALHHGHEGPIHLYHGSLHAEGLYLHEQLRALEREHANFQYEACVLGGEAPDDVRQGMLDAILLERIGSLKGFRAFLCGAPDFVKLMQRKVFLGGVSLQDIYADAFLPAVASSISRT